MEIKYINKNNLEAWLKQIVDSKDRVITRKDDEPVFFKEAVFPKAEIMFSYEKIDGKVEVEDFNENKVPETVLWGIKPCETAGFKPLTAIFNWDYKDKLYNAHLNRTTIVSFACNEADDYCFCTSVGGAPDNTSGSDIQLTFVENGDAIVEILTEKGQNLVNIDSNLFEADKNLSKEKYIAKVEKQFDLATVVSKLDTAFESDVWKNQASRCLGCGACAFVCPTCACFDIQEDKHGSKGNRVRCWDSCGLSLFTLHTSGHNPRETQAQRWRQRILHKFSYMPERLDVFGCTGCGRCGRLCPVDMNILEHLKTIETL